MPNGRSISVVLLAALYLTAAFGNTLCFMVPPVGSGVPTVQGSAGQPKQTPRPHWTPRRHLPLVKFLVFDHHSANGDEQTHDRDRLETRVPPKASLYRQDHSISPSPGRAPPVS
jgi:hypothetical protein